MTETPSNEDETQKNGRTENEKQSANIECNNRVAISNSQTNQSLPAPQAANNSDENNIQTVDEFKNLMYKMQETRRKIVHALLNGGEVCDEFVDRLRQVCSKLTDENTHAFQREMNTVASSKLSLNIKDETKGLEKDLSYLNEVKQARAQHAHSPVAIALSFVDLKSILAAYHPVNVEKFNEEYEATLSFLRSFTESESNGRKPIFITDWDGTMKDYCSQYATNLQPIYSAVGLARFAERFTRLSAVLTAGPLRGPGILDLTAMPIDGPVMFSGSWGREWWLGGKRVVHEDGISDDGFDALTRLDEEMKNLLRSGDYASFALVGSGVQRKVDRLTLGVQTVCHHVTSELSNRYQNEIKERMHRVDPNRRILVFDPSTELEVEVVAHSSGTVWNKADGVDHLVKSLGDSLEGPGKVLICGDTPSDLPMVRQAAKRNPKGVLAIFVGAKPPLRQEVTRIVGDASRCCFVTCPDVIHAVFAQLLNERCSAETSTIG